MGHLGRCDRSDEPLIFSTTCTCKLCFKVIEKCVKKKFVQLFRCEGVAKACSRESGQVKLMDKFSIELISIACNTYVAS